MYGQNQRSEDGCELFIGNLGYLDEGPLEKYFSQYGQVRVKVIRDRDTQESRGFAFATFEDTIGPKKALEQGNSADIDGQYIDYKMSKPKNDTRRDNSYSNSGGNNSEESNELFLASLGHLDEGPLEKHFSQYGSVKVRVV